MMLHIKKILFVGLIILALAIAGCTDGARNPGDSANNPRPGGSSQQSPVSPNDPQQQTMRVKVYYATKDAMSLVAETHIVEKNDQPARTAIDFLFREPQNKELVKVMPEGAKLLKIQIKDQVAYVDFNNKLIKNNVGGSAAETLLVGAIVNTLTEFPEIQRVQILVEGKKIDTISGHMDISEPLSRSEKIIKKSL